MKRTRRGSAYVLVLGASMLIVTVGVSSVMIARQSASSAASKCDSLDARASALAGMTMALEAADRDTTWRAQYAESPICLESEIDGAAIRVAVADPSDGMLDDEWTDPIQLRATSTFGLGSRTYQAVFEPVCREVDSLQFALCASGDIAIDAVQIDAIGSIASGGFIRVRSDDVRANSWSSVSGIGGLPDRETSTRVVLAPELPHADGIDALVALARPISATEVVNCTLSEGVNPWGRPSTGGVYVIDCRGGGARIRNARIRSTIIFLNADRGVRIEGSVSIESARDSLPAIVVDGPCDMNIEREDLSESSVGVNFNPTGSPFDGRSDNDRRDVYGSVINGTVWIRGDLRVRGGGLTCDGAILVDGDVSLESPVALRHVAMKTALRGFAVRERWRQRDGSFTQVIE